MATLNNTSDYSEREINAVRDLNDWLDDPEGSMENVPEAKSLIDAAWYVTEDFIRGNTGKCSSMATRKDEHAPETGPTFTCQCCRYFHQIGPKSRALARIA